MTAEQVAPYEDKKEVEVEEEEVKVTAAPEAAEEAPQIIPAPAATILKKASLSLEEVREENNSEKSGTSSAKASTVGKDEP